MTTPDPKYETNGVPYCSHDCPSHDGKRCEILGYTPSVVCEPAVQEMAKKMADLRASCVEPTSEEAMREQMFKTMQALERVAQAFLTRDVSASDTPVTCFQCGSTRCGRLPSPADQTPKPISTGPTQAIGDKLTRAIALLVFEVFSANEKPNRVGEYQIHKLLGIRTCETCRGSGLERHGESCEDCDSRGFLTA